MLELSEEGREDLLQQRRALWLCLMCGAPLQSERSQLSESLVHQGFCWHCIQNVPIAARVEVLNRIRMVQL